VFAFLGSDCGAHLCEEIANPSRNVPMVIVFPLIIGLLTAFPFACALMYSISDMKAVLNTTTGLPLIEIYFQATQSAVTASILLAAFAFCFFGCLVANGKAYPQALPLKWMAHFITQLQPHPALYGQCRATEPSRLAKCGCGFIADFECLPTPLSSPEHVSQ
jgi:amino acid transporter